MKYLSIILLAVFGAINVATAQEDAISKYFSKYEDADNFTTVYVSPRLFQIIGRIDADDMDDDMKSLIKDLKGLRVLTTEENGRKYYNEAIKTINTKGYETLVKVKDDGEDVKILIKEDGDIITELLLLVGSEDEFVLVSFVGRIDIDKISKLSDSMDIDGLEHLDKIGDNEEEDDEDDDDKEDDK